VKKPQSPPNFRQIEADILASPDIFLLAWNEGKKTEDQGKYLHWDILRHKTAPTGLTHQQWWYGIKIHRHADLSQIPLEDVNGNFFYYKQPSFVEKELHQIDFKTTELLPKQVTDPDLKNQYLMHSLIQEAVTSSQLEGASTTRDVAKKMLQTGRTPRDKDEQMIFNNYLTMQHIASWKDLPLSEELVFEIHRQITNQTLEDSNASGRFRREEDRIIIEDINTGDTLHKPPNADELSWRMKEMITFANSKDPWIHPIIRAIILHFWLAYDHPFIDGNGRTARALFYWSLLRNGYTIFEHISISEILLQAPVKYAEAFLYTETDENDLTYFIIHQIDVIRKAINSLHSYVESKMEERKDVQALLQAHHFFNSRQEALLIHALHHPNSHYTVQEHKITHRIAQETARKDLQDLHARGFLEMKKIGKGFVYKASPNLRDAVKK
jgi:Fic family protein